MSTNLPAEFRRADTDFGRATSGETDVSLAAALREHAGRMARADALRYQLAMGLLGFIGGLAIVVPLVLWVAPNGGSILPGATAAQPPAFQSRFVAADSASTPTLVSAPTLAARDGAPTELENESQGANGVGTAPAQVNSSTDNAVELARAMIRSGDIIAARRVLGQPELRQSGQALFMLAETYDPNVLAALGTTNVEAETVMARQYYQAALAEGVIAASPRLAALE